VGSHKVSYAKFPQVLLLAVWMNIASFYWWSSNGKPAVFGGLVFLWLSYACVPGAKFSQLTSDNRWQATRR
jgi:hypothetical protein